MPEWYLVTQMEPSFAVGLFLQGLFSTIGHFSAQKVNSFFFQIVLEVYENLFGFSSGLCWSWVQIHGTTIPNFQF